VGDNSGPTKMAKRWERVVIKNPLSLKGSMLCKLVVSKKKNIGTSKKYFGDKKKQGIIHHLRKAFDRKTETRTLLSRVTKLELAKEDGWEVRDR